VAGAVEKP
jgi:hypothetical protein